MAFQDAQFPEGTRQKASQDGQYPEEPRQPKAFKPKNLYQGRKFPEEPTEPWQARATGGLRQPCRQAWRTRSTPTGAFAGAAAPRYCTAGAGGPLRHLPPPNLLNCALSLQEKSGIPLHFRLQQNLTWWKRNAPQHIVQLIKNGVSSNFRLPPFLTLKNQQKSVADQEMDLKVLREYLEVGAVVKNPPGIT